MARSHSREERDVTWSIQTVKDLFSFEPEVQPPDGAAKSDDSDEDTVPVPDDYCWLCFKPFKNRAMLRLHFKRFHELGDREPLPEKPATMAKPEFACEACGAKFSSADSRGHHKCKKAE